MFNIIASPFGGRERRERGGGREGEEEEGGGGRKEGRTVKNHAHVYNSSWNLQLSIKVVVIIFYFAFLSFLCSSYLFVF